MSSKSKVFAIAFSTMALCMLAAPTAGAEPQQIFVPTGLVAPDGLINGAGSVSSVENAWPIYADFVFPALKPILQGAADASAVIFNSIENGVNALPPELQGIVPGFLR